MPLSVNRCDCHTGVGDGYGDLVGADQGRCCRRAGGRGQDAPPLRNTPCVRTLLCPATQPSGQAAPRLPVWGTACASRGVSVGAVAPAWTLVEDCSFLSSAQCGGLPGAALTTGVGWPGGSRGWACPPRCSSRGGGRPVHGPGAHTLGRRAWWARLQLSPSYEGAACGLQGLPASPAPSLPGLGHSDPSASSRKRMGKKGRSPGEGPSTPGGPTRSLVAAVSVLLCASGPLRPRPAPPSPAPRDPRSGWSSRWGSPDTHTRACPLRRGPSRSQGAPRPHPARPPARPDGDWRQCLFGSLLFRN